MDRHPLQLTAVIALAATVPLPAADLVEPFERGLSNLEIAIGGELGDRRPELCSLVGFGLSTGLSLAVTARSTTDGALQPGAVAVLSRSFDQGPEVDVWLEISRSAGTGEHAPWSGSAGLEWSVGLETLTPYLRLEAHHGDRAWRPGAVLGVALDATATLDLHLEAHAIRSPEGPALLGLAIGPNLKLAPRLELITEIRFTSRPGRGRGAAALVGVVVDPRSPS